MTNQLPDEIVEAARERLKKFLREHPDVSCPDIAAHTTLSDVTVRSFAVGSCRGGREVVGEITRVLDGIGRGDIILRTQRSVVAVTEDHSAPARRVRKRRDFYVTQTYKKICAVLDYCVEHAAIGVITADFGVGKTEAVKAWRSGPGRKVDCLVFEFDEFSSCNKVDFVAQIALALGLTPARGQQNGASIFRSVCEALRARPCLLIFDQAELARTRICQIIRQIWDRTSDVGVGVVVLGAPILATRMLGSRMADLGALTSRVGIWGTMTGFTRAEMAAIVRQEGITSITDGAMDLWYRACGGSMRRLMRSVDLLSAKHSGKEVTERTISGMAGHLWGMQVRPDDE